MLRRFETGPHKPPRAAVQSSRELYQFMFGIDNAHSSTWCNQVVAELNSKVITILHLPSKLPDIDPDSLKGLRRLKATPASARNLKAVNGIWQWFSISSQERCRAVLDRWNERARLLRHNNGTLD